jgi:ATP-dependent RNA helicase DDX3X
MSDHGQDNFATADMSEALQDVTKGGASAGAPAPGRDPEAAAKARQLGWVQPEAYNYPAYNAGSGKEREEAETLHNLETWGHKAARYEWLEEYGDVGPANAELEETLFRSEHQQRTGLKFDA